MTDVERALLLAVAQRLADAWPPSDQTRYISAAIAAVEAEQRAAGVEQAR